MSKSVDGKAAVANYLSREWDLDQLESWAIEFGDHPEDRLDEWSMGISGAVLERLREYEHGIHTPEELAQSLKEEIAAVGTPG